FLKAPLSGSGPGKMGETRHVGVITVQRWMKWVDRTGESSFRAIAGSFKFTAPQSNVGIGGMSVAQQICILAGEGCIQQLAGQLFGNREVAVFTGRSEERRVGKERRSGWWPTSERDKTTIA